MAYYNGRKVFQVLRNVISSGTVVTVDGEPVETFNADTKLDTHEDNYYPELSVGDAEHAQNADFAAMIESDREIEDAEEACPPVVFGTVGGSAEVQSGLMPFLELRGHTIKWNQLVQNGNFADDSVWSKEAGVTLTVANNVGTYTTTTAEHAIGTPVATIAGHKYAFSLKMRSDNVSKVTMRGRYGSGLGTTFDITSSWSAYAYVGSTSIDGNPIYIYAMTAGTVELADVNVFDLTEMFGAGKEPSTPSEFFALFPLSYYEYNAGTPISCKSSSVDFIRRNQWDEEWETGILNSDGSVSSGSCVVSKNYIPVLPGETYFCVVVNGNNYVGRYAFYDANKNLVEYSSDSARTLTVPINAVYLKFCTNAVYGSTYLNDICIYINWETPGLPYVPYSKQTITLPNIELRSVGDVYDVLYQQGGGKRRVGTVDLGTLDWTYNSEKGAFYATVSDAPNYTNNVLCSKYPTVQMAVIWTGEQDDVCSMQNNYIGASYNKRIVIRDTSYTDATTFTAAMDGVMLYYELATETDITVEENPGWTEYAEIDNFGTVKFNQSPAQDIPVPQAYFVRYTVNLVEFLDSVGERAGFDAGNIALLEDIVVPDAPTTDGTYTLKVTVSSGTPSYSWVADE